jgi:hypothetical protein
MICPFDSPSRDLLSWWKGLPDFLQKTLGQAASDGPRDAVWALTLLALWYTTWRNEEASVVSSATKDLITIIRRATERDALRADVPLPGHEWRKLSESPPDRKPVRLLCQASNGSRWTFDAALDAGGWRLAQNGQRLADHWTPLAWRPADSTELPEGWTP